MTFQQILGIAIPSITFFLIMVVGMDIRTDDFRKVRSSRKVFLVGTFGQYLLPLCGCLILMVLNPVPAIVGGMILVASAPAGGISNYYCLLARANVALSVVLTSTSVLLAGVTMPFLLELFQFLLPHGQSYLVPLPILIRQLFLLLMIPVFLGWFIRTRFPGFVQSYSKILRWIGFLLLGALIGFIFYQTKELFLENWKNITQASVCFIAVSMLLGYALGLLFRLERKDVLTLLIEYGTRNIAIATAVAVVVLQRTDFATFGALYFLVEAVVILPLIACFRRFSFEISTNSGTILIVR